MNGFDFVSKALAITDYQLTPLLEFTEGLEADWLEFKASIRPLSPEEETRFNEADYVFNLVKALTAMANASGGVVVLGVDDSGQPCGLEASGLDADKDAFTRRLVDKVLLRTGWKTKSSGNWQWKHNIDQLWFAPEWGKLGERDVIVFLVKPKEGETPLVLSNRATHKEEFEDVVFLRLSGTVGRVQKLSLADALVWWSNGRDTHHYSEKYSQWLAKLDPKDSDQTVRVDAGALVRLLDRVTSLEDEVEALRGIREEIGSGALQHSEVSDALSERAYEATRKWQSLTGSDYQNIGILSPVLGVERAPCGRKIILHTLNRDGKKVTLTDFGYQGFRTEVFEYLERNLGKPAVFLITWRPGQAPKLAADTMMLPRYQALWR